MEFVQHEALPATLAFFKDKPRIHKNLGFGTSLDLSGKQPTHTDKSTDGDK